MAHTEAQEQHRRNTLNDLNAKDWLASTVSVWHQRGLGAKHPDTQIERQHPAPFSMDYTAAESAERAIIERFLRNCS